MAALIKQYATHPNQYLYQGKVFVSTFSGHDCGNDAWNALRSTLAGQGVQVRLASFPRHSCEREAKSDDFAGLRSISFLHSSEC